MTWVQGKAGEPVFHGCTRPGMALPTCDRSQQPAQDKLEEESSAGQDAEITPRL